MKCEMFVKIIKGPLAGKNVGHFLGFIATPGVTVPLLGSVYALVILTRWIEV
jgi:hypothetical protein